MISKGCFAATTQKKEVSTPHKTTYHFLDATYERVALNQASPNQSPRKQKNMKKTLYMVVAALIIAAALTGILLIQPSQKPQTTTISQGFEDGLDAWVTGADVPADPNHPGHTVNWTINIVTNQSFAGNRSAQFYLDGRQDDGTIWLTRNITLTPNTTKNITITFQLWSSNESFNTIANAVAHIGTKNATTEGDFHVIGAANQAAGWKSYSYTTQVETDASGNINVALGISAVWETQMTYYLDDVVVTAN